MIDKVKVFVSDSVSYLRNLTPQYVLPVERTPEGVDGRVVCISDPKTFISEQFRSLAGKLLISENLKDKKSLLFTSCQPGEGKTTMSSNLAVCMGSNFGLKTLLIDCDLRRPNVHNMFGIKKSPGLSDLLHREVSIDDVIVETPYKDVYILPCGSMIDDPVELFSSSVFEEVLFELKDRFDKVLMDAPPVLKVADVGVLGGKCDAVLFVVKAEVTPKKLIEEAISGLRGTSAMPQACLFAGMNVAPDLYSYVTNTLYRQNYYEQRYVGYGTESLPE